MTAENPGTGEDLITLYPSPRLKSLYNIYLLVIVWCFVIPGLLLLIIVIEPVTRVFISIIALILALLAIVLIRKYAESRFYIFHQDTMEVRRGLISERPIIVPYTRIMGTEIIRHRLPAFLGIATVRITYMTSSGRNGRIDLDGIENPEDLRSRILLRTRERSG
jgi:membrane protein YdbS with pleckstrin-like domain